MITEYKGLEIINKDFYKKGDKNIIASYKSGTIILYQDFHNRDSNTQKQALYHEYSHHIWYKLPRVYKLIWRIISNGKLIPILHDFGLTSYTKNAFARKYGETNYKEDFATCGGEIESQRLKGPRLLHTFADFKISVVKSLISKHK